NMDHNRGIPYGCFTPDALVKVIRGKDFFGMGDEKPQKLKFRVGEKNHLISPLYRLAVQIQSQIFKGQDVRRGGFLRSGFSRTKTAGSAQNGPDPKQKLSVGKRLNDIIVCSGGKAHNLIRLSGIGGKEDNG